MNRTNSRYPRSLTTHERRWLEWVLPAERDGYRAYRKYLDTMVVLGEGRRGKGDFVLGFAGDAPDTTISLPPVFAYGVIETNFGPLSITVRENYGDQVDVEIVSHRGDELPDVFEETRRWTYSTWSPGNACPQCQQPLREVSMHAPAQADPGEQKSAERTKHFVLAICANDRRLWVFDAETQVNHLIPITNFYNELMLHRNVRDAEAALNSNRLFTELSSFTDSELTRSFLTYNTLKRKVEVQGTLVADKEERRTFRERLKTLFVRSK